MSDSWMLRTRLLRMPAVHSPLTYVLISKSEALLIKEGIICPPRLYCGGGGNLSICEIYAHQNLRPCPQFYAHLWYFEFWGGLSSLPGHQWYLCCSTWVCVNLLPDRVRVVKVSYISTHTGITCMWFFINYTSCPPTDLFRGEYRLSLAWPLVTPGTPDTDECVRTCQWLGLRGIVQASLQQCNPLMRSRYFRW